MGRAAVRVICRKNAADAMARGGGSVCPADCHIYTVDRFPKKSGMARLHLSTFKLAGVIPRCGMGYAILRQILTWLMDA